MCVDLVIQVDDFPSDEVLDQMGAESEFDLLGLFQGVGLPFRSESAPVQMPNMIWLYRRPILDYWAEHDETLGAIVRHVLVHEIGHHFGLSDADMAAIEKSAEEAKGASAMKVDGACHCGFITIEAEVDPEKGHDLPLHRLSVGHGLGVSRLDPDAGQHFQDDGTTDDLRENRGKRQSARAGVLPKMRLADLFDDARRRPEGFVHVAGRHFAPARSTCRRSGRSGFARRSPGSTDLAASQERDAAGHEPPALTPAARLC